MKYIVICFLGISFGLAFCLDETKAYAGKQMSAENEFSKEPTAYYVRWALMYCLGYVSNENKMYQMPKCKARKETKNPHHIDNMVQLFGNQAFKEIKAYIDKNLEYETFDKGRVNTCFEKIYYNNEIQEKFKAIVEKHRNEKK
ncbi:MAG: hypothetical protein SPJ16_04270 [Helicobacter sp.]|uniref:hypothetical protein n=1 Tax=Helicobacter sp. TaxID=218 RepID=UPI002A9104FA|nr:hypothetical protein [Helicobacter sp.]MDY5950392.1 hypothetical protein [Helicobacter sp.]